MKFHVAACPLLKAPGKVVNYVHRTWESRHLRPTYLVKSSFTSIATDKVANHVQRYLGKSQISSIIHSEIMQSRNLEPEKRGLWMGVSTLHDKKSNYQRKIAEIGGFNHNVYAKTCIIPLLIQKYLGKPQISSKKCQKLRLYCDYII